MEFKFKSRKLAKTLQFESSIQKAYGALAKNLMMRLSELKAARNLSEMPDCAHLHPLTRDRKGQISVRIKENWSLVFTPDMDEIPLLSDGGVDLARIDAIMIVEVVDYHGE